MAKEDIVVHQFNNITAEQQQKIASMGGKASAEARRKKKTIKENAELLLSLSNKNAKIEKVMDELGIDKEDQTNQMAMVISMLNVALKGGKGAVQAFNTLQATIGEKPIEEVKVTNLTSEKFDEICSQIGGDGLDE